MLILLLIIAGAWLFCFAGLPITTLWRFRWTALSAICFALAGLRTMASGPWEQTYHLEQVGPPTTQAAAALGNGAQELGSTGTGIVLLLIALWVARNAHDFWVAYVRGFDRL